MTRELLPERRVCMRFPVIFWGQEFVVQISLFEDGRVAESFVTGVKSGTDVQHLSRDGTIVLSIALQYGAPLDVIRKSLARDENDKPASLIGAICDAMAKEGIVLDSLQRGIMTVSEVGEVK